MRARGAGAPELRTVAAVLERWELVHIEDCRATRALRDGSAAEGHAVDGPAAALALVRAGAAAAVVTRRDLLPSDDGLLVLELADAPPRVLGLAWHLENDACPSTQALRRAACAVFAEAQR